MHVEYFQLVNVERKRTGKRQKGGRNAPSSRTDRTSYSAITLTVKSTDCPGPTLSGPETDEDIPDIGQDSDTSVGKG